MSVDKQASGIKGLDHYAVISALKKFKTTIVVSNKEWEKAVFLMGLEIRDAKTQFLGTQLPNTRPLVSAPIQSNKTEPLKKPKKSPPAPNPVKQSPEYKALQNLHSITIEKLKDPSVSEDERLNLLTSVKGAETQMKILRGRPNVNASAENVRASSQGSVSVSSPSPPVASSVAVATNKAAVTKMELGIPKGHLGSSVVAKSELYMRPSAKWIEENLNQGFVLDFMSRADLKAISNGIANNLYATNDLLISRWIKGRMDFEMNAKHRIQNGGTRLQ